MYNAVQKTSEKKIKETELIQKKKKKKKKEMRERLREKKRKENAGKHQETG